MVFILLFLSKDALEIGPPLKPKLHIDFTCTQNEMQ